MKFLLIPVWCLFLAAFASGQGGPPDTSKPVTYTTVAVPLRRAFAEIGKSAGIKFEIDGSMAEEPVILRLQAVPLKDVMDRVAAMEGAEWKTVDGDFLLYRSSDDIDRLARADAKRRVDAIKTSIDAMAKEAASEGRMTAAKAEDYGQKLMAIQKAAEAGASPAQNASIRGSMRRAMPASRIFAQILSSFDPADLAALKPGGRYVFSSAPTAMQYPLPNFDPDLLTQFFQDQNLMNDTVTAILKKSSGMPSQYLDNYAHVDSPPVRVRVVIQPWIGMNAMNVAVELIDAKGVDMGGMQRAVATSWDPAEKRPQEAQFQRDAVSQGIEVRKPILDLALAYFRSSKEDLPPLDPNLVAKIADPTSHDPLSFATSEIVLSLASKQNANSIFLPVDDDEEMSLLACRTGHVSWDLFKVEMQRRGDMELNQEPGWLTGKPASPLVAATYRWPRPALEKFTQSLVTNGFAGIDDLAEVVLTMPHGTGMDLLDLYEKLLLGKEANSQGMPSEEVLRLWASLSAEQKAAAAKGALSISRDQLDSMQRSLANDFVFLGQKSLWLEQGALKGLTPDQQSQAFTDSENLERTEAYPSGIPSEAKIDFKDELVDTFFYTSTSDGGITRQDNGDLNEMASYYAQAQRTDLFPVMAKFSVQDVRYGIQRKVTVDARLDGKHYLSESIDENHKATPKGVSLDQIRSILPADAQDRFDKRVAYLLAQFKKMNKSDIANLDGEEPKTAPPPR